MLPTRLKNLCNLDKPGLPPNNTSTDYKTVFLPWTTRSRSSYLLKPKTETTRWALFHVSTVSHYQPDLWFYSPSGFGSRDKSDKLATGPWSLPPCGTLLNPHPITAVDIKPIGKERITHQTAPIKFQVGLQPLQPIILEHPWLTIHDSHISLRRGEITVTVLSPCLQHQPSSSSSDYQLHKLHHSSGWGLSTDAAGH